MWQELVDLIGMTWIIIVLLAAAVIFCLALVFFVAIFKLFNQSVSQFKKFDASLTDLPGNRIENLEQAKTIASDMMNPEFNDCLDKLFEDSQNIYNGLWVPSPNTRLTLPEILTAPARLIGKKSNGFALLLGGIAGTTLALSVAFVSTDLESFVASDLLRLIAILPFLVGALGLLLLYQASEFYHKKLRHQWEILMVTFERKMPVYSQASETARLIIQMQEYDAHMAKSVASVATHVEAMSSGKLTDAVSNAVKYVMSATVGPAVVKSTESLGLLVNEIEKRMKETDLHVAKLYTELETRQDKQSELWFKRYQEIADTLSYQQENMLKRMTDNEQRLVDDLGKSQKFALEKVVSEQTTTLEHINSVSQKSWSLLQEKLTSIISQLSDNQTTLLTNLQTEQDKVLTTLSETSEQTAMTMRSQYDDIFEKIGHSIDSSFENINQAQQDGMKQMREQQSEAMALLSENQKASLSEIDARQSETLKHINENQSGALTSIAQNQAKAIEDFRQAQFDALAESASRQQETLQQLAENFGEAVSSKLSGYLDPITSRLHDASEALIKAQNYASRMSRMSCVCKTKRRPSCRAASANCSSS